MERERLGSRLGFILLSAGCAIGVGNVWKFPYMTGQYGGGAFVLIYLLCLILLGVPVMTMEFAMGRASQKSPVKLYEKLEPKGSKWHIHGYFAMAGNYILMFFYTVVTGWMVRYFVDMASGKFQGASVEDVDRMYGIGAAFDTAGTRFACALVMIAYLTVNCIREKKKEKEVYVFLLIFIFIAIVGSMVARTTLAGLLLALLYWIYDSKIYTFRICGIYKKIGYALIITMVVCIPLVVFLNTLPEFNKLFRFAFEGFYNLSESGSFETDSTDILLEMWKHVPNSVKTWIIGDGYFLSPYATNSNYLGIHQYTYYMGVDVGYLRFIYYFGFIGLFAFICFFVQCTRTCIEKFHRHRVLFIMILMMNLIIWAKVATDLFCVFALFLAMDYKSSNKSALP